jgi:hypothetical protein
MGGVPVSPDILAQGAAAAQQQGGQGPQNLTSFGPAPLVQPPPQVRFQPPQIQKPQAGNEFRTASGNARATKQSAFSAIASMVKAGGDYVTAKKTRTLQMNIERLMEAQQGLTEAQQKLQQNPNDPEAKKAVEQNTAIVNDITKDPKINKQLQKAFNIDLFGNGKNKQENQALIGAWQAFDKKKQAGDKTALNPVAQRLMQGQPMRQQIDPAVIQQAQLIKMGINPTANELLKSNTELAKMYSTAKTSEERTAAIDKAAETRAKAEMYHADKLIDAANIRTGGQQYAAEVRSRAQLKVAGMVANTWDKRLAVLKSNVEGNTNAKVMYDRAKSYNDELKTITTENTKLQSELDKKGSGWFGYKSSAASDPDSRIMQNKIQTNNLRAQYLQKQLTDVQQNMQLLNRMGVMQLNEPDKEGSEDSGGEVDVDDKDVPE